jgi:hypothetical protein
MESEKWYKKKKYQVGFGIFAILFVIGLASGDEETSVNENGIKEYKATSFYDLATDIEQHGQTLYITIAPSLDGTGYTKEKTAGTLNVSLRWSGHGVSNGKTAKTSIAVSEEQYNCTVFCKAKLTIDVPTAYIGAAWLDATIELIPKGKTSGFKTSKRVITL